MVHHQRPTALQHEARSPLMQGATSLWACRELLRRQSVLAVFAGLMLALARGGVTW